MIDVLLPFHGDTDLMHEAVQSVLAQTRTDWRLHVLDDANPDRSVHDWLRRHPDPRITAHRSERQLGVNAAFRRCLGYGEAELVTFMGCDDRMHPDHLAHLEDVAGAHPEAAVVQPGVSVIDSSGEPSRPMGDRIKALLGPGPGVAVMDGEPLLRSLMHGNWLYFPSLLWRREALVAHPLRPGLETALDLQLIVDLLLAGHSIAVSDHVTFDYRRHAASASSASARTAVRFQEELAVTREAATACEQRGWHSAARAARWHLTSRAHALMLAASCARRGAPRPALHMLRTSLARS